MPNRSTRCCIGCEHAAAYFFPPPPELPPPDEPLPEDPEPEDPDEPLPDDPELEPDELDDPDESLPVELDEVDVEDVDPEVVLSSDPELLLPSVSVEPDLEPDESPSSVLRAESSLASFSRRGLVLASEALDRTLIRSTVTRWSLPTRPLICTR